MLGRQTPKIPDAERLNKPKIPTRIVYAGNSCVVSAARQRSSLSVSQKRGREREREKWPAGRRLPPATTGPRGPRSGPLLLPVPVLLPLPTPRRRPPPRPIAAAVRPAAPSPRRAHRPMLPTPPVVVRRRRTRPSRTPPECTPPRAGFACCSAAEWPAPG